MRFIVDALQSIAITLWVGGLWAIGLIVAPLLFHSLGDRSQAGMLAGLFFTAIAYIGLGCGAYLLLFRLARFGGQAFGQLLFWSVLLMMALAAAGQLCGQPNFARVSRPAVRAEVRASNFQHRVPSLSGTALRLCL